jgi:hypothetical protein
MLGLAVELHGLAEVGFGADDHGVRLPARTLESSVRLLRCSLKALR